MTTSCDDARVQSSMVVVLRRRSWSRSGRRFSWKGSMKRISNLAILIIALAAAAMGQSPASAQTQPQPGTLLTEAPPSASDAPIGPRDVIEVKVFQDPNLYTKMTVTDDGRITMPFLGKIEVSGL